VPAVAEDRSLAEIERKRGRDFAAGLSMRVLSRTWQMLFKGLAEVKDAARPIAAAEMVLVRIAYAADLPSPEEVIRSLGDAPPRAAVPGRGNGAPAPLPTGPASYEPPRAGGRPALAPSVMPHPRDPVSRSVEAPAQAAPASPAFARFADLIAFVGEQRDLQLKTALERDVRLVRFEDGKLEIALEPSASKSLIGDLARRLGTLTGRRWMVAVSAEAGEPTVRTQLDAKREEFRRGVQADPLVQCVLARFPGAQIVAVRQPEREPPPVAAVDDEEPLPETPVEHDESAFGAYGRPDDVDDDF
jgi:DNA polymerase III subunit gamma/tau